MLMFIKHKLTHKKSDVMTQFILSLPIVSFPVLEDLHPQGLIDQCYLSWELEPPNPTLNRIQGQTSLNLRLENAELLPETAQDRTHTRDITPNPRIQINITDFVRKPIQTQMEGRNATDYVKGRGLEEVCLGIRSICVKQILNLNLHYARRPDSSVRQSIGLP